MSRALERVVVSTDDPRILTDRLHALLRLSHLVGDRLRTVQSRQVNLPLILSHDGKERLQIWINEPAPPWRDTALKAVNIPGMITLEECRYYKWIGRFYSGVGEAIEIGAWLGRSTYFIANGLVSNPHFHGHRLHVVDDFVWRSAWMDEYVARNKVLPNHSDFSSVFHHHTRIVADHLSVEQRRLTLSDGNEHVEEFSWDRGPVELVFVDCGRTLEVNERWYSILRNSFIPDRTLIVMQDWRLHREVPTKWYNQTKQFTDSKGRQLQLLHEVLDGGVATFLFRG